MIIRWVKKKGFRYLQLFHQNIQLPQRQFWNQRGAHLHILTCSCLVKGTKFSISLPPCVGFAFLYPIRDQHRKLLFPRGSTQPIPKLLFSQMLRCESVTLSLIVVVYVYSYVYCKYSSSAKYFWKYHSDIWYNMFIPIADHLLSRLNCTFILLLIHKENGK